MLISKMIPQGKFGNSDISEEVKLVVINLNAEGLVSIKGEGGDTA